MRFPIGLLSLFLTALVTHGVAQETIPKSEKKQEPATQPQTKPNEAQQRQQERIKKRLMGAMEQLIPGELKPGSERSKQLENVANLFAQGKAKDCKTALDAIVQADKTFPPTNLIFASLFFAVNNGNAGRQFLEKAATENPEYPATYAGFARIAINQNRVTDSDALMVMMKSKIDAGQWNEEQAKQFRVEYLDIKTDIAMRRNQLDQAGKFLEELAKIIPKDNRVPVRQARVCFQEKKLDEAIAFLNKARQGKEEEVIVPALMIANWYRQSNDYENLAKWIEKAAAEHEDDKNVQVEYARWLVEQQKLNKANIWITRAEKNSANEIATTFMKGQIAFIKKNFDVAEMHFHRIHTAQPGNLDATNLLALSLVESNNPTKQRKALELAKISVGVAPKNAAAVSVLGWVLYKLGDIPKAAQQLNPISQQRRLSPESAYFVAQFLADQGRPKNALLFLDAISENPGIFLYRRQADELKQKLQSEMKSNENKKSEAKDKGGKK